MIKKIFLLGVLAFTCCFYSNAQEFKKNVLRGGVGYFKNIDIPKPSHILWFEAGRKFSTGFNVNLRSSYAVTTETMGLNMEMFEGQDRLDIYFMIDLVFSRPIRITGGHFIEPGVGFKCAVHRYFDYDFDWYQESETTIAVAIDVRPQKIVEYGVMSLSLDYYYLFSNNFMLGLRFDSPVIPSFSFIGTTISPLMGVKF